MRSQPHGPIYDFRVTRSQYLQDNRMRSKSLNRTWAYQADVVLILSVLLFLLATTSCCLTPPFRIPLDEPRMLEDIHDAAHASRDIAKNAHEWLEQSSSARKDCVVDEGRGVHGQACIWRMLHEDTT